MESDLYKSTADSEHYTPEDMMARLKKNEHHKQQSNHKENGELVTRSDGSQVVKVRRRKRRSKQPVKEKKLLNSKIKWTILFSIIGIAILSVAGTVFIIAKYNGATFKQKTEANISRLSGATHTEITQMRVTPISGKARKAQLTWDQHSFIQSAIFQHLDADILATSFLSSGWTGEEIVASQGDVILRTPLLVSEHADDLFISPYNFGSYRCNRLNLRFGDNKGAPAITDMSMWLWKLPDGRSQIVFKNGRLIMDGWPELRISSGNATLNNSDIEIDTLLEAGKTQNGELTVKGTLRRDISKAISLDVRAKNYPLQELLGKGLGRIVRGEISSELGTLQYAYDRQPEHALSFVMPFTSTEIQMRELPLFSDLKNLTGDTQYVRPFFNICNGTLKRTSDGVTIDEIDFKSTSMITLIGKISVENDGRMYGNLTVGLPRRYFDPAKLPSGFVGPKDGQYTVDVTVSGTIHNPYDNLNEILKSGPDQRDQAPNPLPAPLVTPKSPPIPADKEAEFNELLR